MAARAPSSGGTACANHLQGLSVRFWGIHSRGYRGQFAIHPRGVARGLIPALGGPWSPCLGGQFAIHPRGASRGRFVDSGGVNLQFTRGSAHRSWGPTEMSRRLRYGRHSVPTYWSRGGSRSKGIKVPIQRSNSHEPSGVICPGGQFHVQGVDSQVRGDNLKFRVSLHW
eukprot:1142571-Prorocentrum_minimum.AAC.3